MIAVGTTSTQITPTGKVKFTWSGYTIWFGNTQQQWRGDPNQVKSQCRYVSADGGVRRRHRHLGSKSTVVNQVLLETMSKATLTSSPNPSTPGQVVTFAAKVSSPAARSLSRVSLTVKRLPLTAMEHSFALAPCCAWK